jgi:hypothetical protein
MKKINVGILSLLYFIAAIVISKQNNVYAISITIAFFVLLGIFIYQNIHFIGKIEKILFNNSQDIENKMSEINKFKFPSTVVYRVRNKYNVSMEEILQSEQEFKSIFKNYLNNQKNYSKDTILLDNNISPFTYIFWDEYFKTGELYKNFCNYFFGKFIHAPYDKISQTKNSLETCEPTLKAI